MLITEIRKSRLSGLIAVTQCALLSLFTISESLAGLPVAMQDDRGFSSGGGSYRVSGNTGIVDQKLQREIFRWASFNIGQDNEVIFNQPGKTAVALNRIFDNDPSVILGKLSANGSVYLINRNGIIFGDGVKGGQVDVGGRFLATTMDFVDIDQLAAGLSDAEIEAIADQRFLEGGLLTPILVGEAALSQLGPDDSAVRVNAGFRIRAGNGESIYLVAPEVVNAGRLQTIDGEQFLVGARDRVFLVQSVNDTRGANLGKVLVEVETGGSVANLGEILAERGKVTLMGMAINQNGLIRATTSVDDNGSIRLLARDGAGAAVRNDPSLNNFSALGFDAVDEIPAFLALPGKARPVAHTGNIIIGSDSVTEVVPDATDKAVADGQLQRTSLVEAMAKTIAVNDGARITSTGGEIRMVATTTATNPVPVGGNINPEVGIAIAGNAVLDVSGSVEKNLAMSRNVIEAELRGNELADAPLQRGGILEGATVQVDARYGTPLADISGFQQGVTRTVRERLSEGGQIRLSSAGRIVVAEKAELNANGGYLQYADGYLTTSKLLTASGQIVDIANADPATRYVSILGARSVTDPRWGITRTYGRYNIFDRPSWVEGFTEGRAGGDITLTAHQIINQGKVSANAYIGPYQRENNTPEGGRLSYLLPFTSSVRQDVVLSAESTDFDISLAASTREMLSQSLADTPLVLHDSMLNRSGIGALRINARGDIFQQADSQISLRPDAEVDIQARQGSIVIDGQWYIPGGRFAINTSQGNSSNLSDNFSISLSENARIEVSGLWVNDLVGGVNTASAEYSVPGQDSFIPVTNQGGRISLEALGDLLLEKGSALVANAGAWLGSDGSRSLGEGGTIELVSAAPQASELQAEGTLEAWGFSQNGSLILSANSLQIGSSDSAISSSSLLLASDFFANGGFADYQLIANAGSIDV